MKLFFDLESIACKTELFKAIRSLTDYAAVFKVCHCAVPGPVHSKPDHVQQNNT